MDLGMVGLGRMGANMTERLLRGGHRVVVYDRDRAAINRAVQTGAMGADSIAAMTARLDPPRAVWIMVPAGKAVDATIEALGGLLSKNDIVIDGGNSNYKDSLRHSDALKDKGIGFVDVGTSGGIRGLHEGYSLMVGGDPAHVERLRPLFECLAPAPDRGWARVGHGGAGHFVKMVHNGIEYGLMQAYAEGFAVMDKKDQFGLDLRQVAEVWRYGSVVRSWLLDLIAEALAEDPGLDTIEPYVEDSGEGRWMVAEAIDLDVPAPAITLSLIQRLRSREHESFSDKMLAVMRQKFGGHSVKLEK
jgi:6-phosphogluconate dehydrogenase